MLKSAHFCEFRILKINGMNLKCWHKIQHFYKLISAHMPPHREKRKDFQEFLEITKSKLNGDATIAPTFHEN